MSFANSSGPEGQQGNKRLRVDDDGNAVPTMMDFEEEDKSRKQDRRNDDHRVEPSPVVHVRSLHPSVIEADLWDTLSAWGKINNIFMMTQKHQALVEFEHLNSAMSLVRTARKEVVNIRQYPTLFNFSKSKKIELPIRHNEIDQRRGEEKEHNVLLFTIRKPMYPITVDVMHTICKSFGRILRIVVFRKSVLQSMVEFEEVKAAVAALKELNGADIYSGCCTLKVEYAKQLTLNVIRNDSETWDFTVSDREASRSKPLLASPNAGPPRLYDDSDRRGGGFGAGAETGFGNGFPRDRDDFGHPGGAAGGAHHGRGAEFGDRRGGGRMDDEKGSAYSGYGGRMSMDFEAGPHPRQPLGSVLILHGLNLDQMNCDRLFNLLCLYGNVDSIKFLKSKEGAALVQMGDRVACERVINNLHGAVVFESRIQVCFSKQLFLEEQNNPGTLKDGSLAFKDFRKSRNNRFMTPVSAARNRLQGPCDLLHFYNAPPSLTEENISQIVENESGVKPDNVKIFPAKPEAKSTSGLLRFESRKAAADVLCLMNHAVVASPDVVSKTEDEDGKPNGHIFKLCFSNSRD